MNKVMFYSGLFFPLFLSINGMELPPATRPADRPENIVRTIASNYFIQKENHYRDLAEKGGALGCVIYDPSTIMRSVAAAPVSIRNNHGLLYTDSKLFWVDIAKRKLVKSPLPFITRAAVTALAFVECDNLCPMILAGHENGDIVRVGPRIAGEIDYFGKVDGKVLDIVVNEVSCMIVARYLYKVDAYLQTPCAAMSVPYMVRDLKSKDAITKWSKFLCMRCEHAITAIDFDDTHCITTFYNGDKRKWVIKSPRHNPELVEE